MIKAKATKEHLALFEALASEVRLEILGLLAAGEMNVKELAEALKLSSAIVTMHVRKLERGGLIETKMVRKDRGTHKMCSLRASQIEISLPDHTGTARPAYEHTIPVGHYSEYEVEPTCGLASLEGIIGQYDDPRYFMEPERMHAKMLWLGKGYVEYRIPNYLMAGQRAEEIEITMELGSEAPGVNENWPSDIQFYLNGVHVGMWTSPGDYGITRGRYTPAWWPTGVNQYGLLKVLRIQRQATFMDGQQISSTGLQDIAAERNHWTLRLAVEDSSTHVGGLTIYGEGFGNYNQDIGFKVYYRPSGA